MQTDPGSTKDELTPERIKHLEMIQNVIARLAGNGAVTKRYSLVVAAAGFALYRVTMEPDILLAMALLVLVFWMMDARYLQDERRFRALYDEVRIEPITVASDFRLFPPPSSAGKTSFRSCALSWSAALYPPLALILICVWISA